MYHTNIRFLPVSPTDAKLHGRKRRHLLLLIAVRPAPSLVSGTKQEQKSVLCGDTVDLVGESGISICNIHFSANLLHVS